MPARVWVWMTQPISGRAAWTALCTVKPASLTRAASGAITLPSRSILTRDDAVISSNIVPKGLRRKCSSPPGTRAEMWV